MAETLVVNTTQWTPFDMRVLNARDEIIDRAPVSYTASPASLFEVRSDGAVWCRADGLGIITVRAAAIQAAATVRCEIVRRFSAPRAVGLTAGGPPAPFQIQAYTASGRVLKRPRLELIIDDTTVIRLDNGMVFGLKKGASAIRARSSGQEGGEVFFVEDSVGKVRLLPRPKSPEVGHAKL